MDMIQYLIFLPIVLDLTMCPMKFFKKVISRMGMFCAMIVLIEKILTARTSLRSMLMFRIMGIIAELISQLFSILVFEIRYNICDDRFHSLKIINLHLPPLKPFSMNTYKNEYLINNWNNVEYMVIVFITNKKKQAYNNLVHLGICLSPQTYHI